MNVLSSSADVRKLLQPDSTQVCCNSQRIDEKYAVNQKEQTNLLVSLDKRISCAVPTVFSFEDQKGPPYEQTWGPQLGGPAAPGWIQMMWSLSFAFLDDV